MSLFDRRPSYNLRVPLFLGTMTLTGVTLMSIVVGIALAIALNIGLVMLAGWGFQVFWAWYVPALSASIPILDYWHSVATVVILLVFLHHLKGHEPKK